MRRHALTRRLARRKGAIAAAVVVGMFALALVLWVGRSPQNLHTQVDPGRTGTSSSTGAIRTSPTPPSSTGPSGSSAPGGQLTLPRLPGLTEGDNIAGAGLPAHQVVLTVTSDLPLLRLAYLVKDSPPIRENRTYIKSPVAASVIAHGIGLEAVLAAQASPGSIRITCTISVDGVVTNTRTVHGGYAVVVCVG
ncbi:MAG: hypothetical protein M3O28_07980 [Actinomycetota bacterium]|nr:hypothetical protein [Actinomycetota bacterium]